MGKTSLLVQFDQGKFIPGSFSATVGIGFTVRARSSGLGLGEPGRGLGGFGAAFGAGGGAVR